MRVLFDSTFTMSSGKQSGIERVVRSLLAVALEQCENNLELNSDVTVVPVFIHDGAIFKLGPDATGWFKSVASYQADCLKSAPRGYEIFAKAICTLVGSRKVRSWLLPSPGHLGIFKSWYKRRLAIAFREAAKNSTQIDVDSNDVLWLPDAYWATSDIVPGLLAAKNSGACIACLVYDLIPLEDEVTGKFDVLRNKNFARYLESIVTFADVVLTISNTVREQLEDFIALQWPNQTASREVFAIPLGAEINVPLGGIRQELSDFFMIPGRVNPYLCLGTFEPRKNQGFVLDAFERLWEDNPEMRICFIGRVGWQCDKIIDRLRTHPERGRRLLVCYNASDAEVGYCYQNCRAFLTASRSEGFGLPIVEAQWHRKPILASKIAVHCEVGGDACTYFDLASPLELVRVVSELENRLAYDSPQSKIGVKITTWAESWENCRGRLIDGFKRKQSL